MFEGLSLRDGYSPIPSPTNKRVAAAAQGYVTIRSPRPGVPTKRIALQRQEGGSNGGGDGKENWGTPGRKLKHDATHAELKYCGAQTPPAPGTVADAVNEKLARERGIAGSSDHAPTLQYYQLGSSSSSSSSSSSRGSSAEEMDGGYGRGATQEPASTEDSGGGGGGGSGGDVFASCDDAIGNALRALAKGGGSHSESCRCRHCKARDPEVRAKKAKAKKKKRDLPATAAIAAMR
jgi:hypothetical protein